MYFQTLTQDGWHLKKTRKKEGLMTHIYIYTMLVLAMKGRRGLCAMLIYYYHYFYYYVDQYSFYTFIPIFFLRVFQFNH